MYCFFELIRGPYNYDDIIGSNDWTTNRFGALELGSVRYGAITGDGYIEVFINSNGYQDLRINYKLRNPGFGFGLEANEYLRIYYKINQNNNRIEIDKWDAQSIGNMNRALQTTNLNAYLGNNELIYIGFDIEPKGGDDTCFIYDISLEGTPEPTLIPSETPTKVPSLTPSKLPTINPTQTPSSFPTKSPTVTLSLAPSKHPSISPSVTHTISPTIAPSITPTITPTTRPSVSPSVTPTISPTIAPSKEPSMAPSATPVIGQTVGPSIAPSTSPTITPPILSTKISTNSPSINPTMSDIMDITTSIINITTSSNISSNVPNVESSISQPDMTAVWVTLCIIVLIMVGCVILCLVIIKVCGGTRDDITSMVKISMNQKSHKPKDIVSPSEYDGVYGENAHPTKGEPINIIQASPDNKPNNDIDNDDDDDHLDGIPGTQETPGFVTPKDLMELKSDTNEFGMDPEHLVDILIDENNINTKGNDSSSTSSTDNNEGYTLTSM